jgi:hypothetical protein
VSKNVLCDKRNTVASLSDDEIHFSWQAQHFGVLHSSFCMAGAALQTCRVACFWQIALSGLHQVVTTCILRGRVVFLRRVENYFLGLRFGNPFYFLDILGFHFGNQFLEFLGFHFGNQLLAIYTL